MTLPHDRFAKPRATKVSAKKQVSGFLETTSIGCFASLPLAARKRLEPMLKPGRARRNRSLLWVSPLVREVGRGRPVCRLERVALNGAPLSIVTVETFKTDGARTSQFSRM